MIATDGKEEVKHSKVEHGTSPQSTSSDAVPMKITLREVKEILDAEVITGESLLSTEVTMGCGADLMSDVLAYTKSGALLLTGLTNPQVVRTAEMAEILAICFVRGKRPGEETVSMARNQGLPLLWTKLPMFESCGRLYKHGLPGVSET